MVLTQSEGILLYDSQSVVILLCDSHTECRNFIVWFSECSNFTVWFSQSVGICLKCRFLTYLHRTTLSITEWPSMDSSTQRPIVTWICFPSGKTPVLVTFWHMKGSGYETLQTDWKKAIVITLNISFYYSVWTCFN